ncbi:MAG TPA: PRC-barrel domain-containing protein [Thermodesulfobacteriota bacterium]|nr:PRC-barrel domain-containing protein [Thermodesulfobacteriota bacterium]
MEKAKTKIYNIYKASSLTGMSVRNVAGEELGTIRELMIDVSEGRIAYAVLSFDSFWGFGDKLFAIPWRALMLKPQEKIFVLDVEKEELKDAPGFNKDNWPDSANPRWDTEIRSYWEARKGKVGESGTEDKKSDTDLYKTPLA